MDLFQEHDQADMYVLDQDVLADYPDLRKDIRALRPDQAAEIIRGMKLFSRVQLLGKAAVQSVAGNHDRIIMPDDDIAHDLAAHNFREEQVHFESIFLRWDRENTIVNVEVEPDRIVQAGDFENEVIQLLYQEAGKSSNWWRRVGAALVVGGKVVKSAHNQHLPTQYTPWIDGDPRSTLKRGVGVELTTDNHAEVDLIAWAAREGIPIAGSSIYVDTFPCPPCAKLIASAGIKKCFFISGYAMVDGLSVLRDAGVEIIKIETDLELPRGKEFVTYPE